MKKVEDKILSGTSRSDRNEPARGNLTSMPRRPAIELSRDGRKFWKAMGDALIREQLLSETDLVALAQFAWWWEKGLEARELLDRKGMIQKYKSGARNISPELTAVEKIDTKLQNYMRYFGLTPYHRERLVTTVTKTASDADTVADQWERLLSPVAN